MYTARSLCVDAATKEELAERAVANDRTLSAEVRRGLRLYLESAERTDKEEDAP